MKSGEGKRILLVESDEPFRRLTALALVRRGYQVLQATSAAKAIALWVHQPGPVDLLMADVILEGPVSGADLAAQLRDCQPTLKVILMGNGESEEAIISTINRNRAGFLKKPYSIEQLVQAVRNSLESTPS